MRDRTTRAIWLRRLDEDLTYTAAQLDRSVTTPNQIRTVIQCYKDSLFTQLFPERPGA